MSPTPKLSAYCHLFNARAGSFDLDGFIENATSFFDEVSVATLATQSDDTLDRFLAHQARLGEDRLKVIVVDLDITKGNRFDGDLKTAALKACSPSTAADPRVYIIMDADERVVAGNRPIWVQYANTLLLMDGVDGLLLPVVDLWSQPTMIRADQNTGVKFRMHKDTIKRRGVIPQAERMHGRFDTTQSDGTEPLNEYGRLGVFAQVIHRAEYLNPAMSRQLAAYPYVIHEGFLDLDRRAALGRSFWKDMWSRYSGHEENVATSRAELVGHPLVPHHLAWPEEKTAASSADYRNLHANPPYSGWKS